MLCVTNRRVLVLFNLWLVNTVLASERNKPLEYDVNLVPLNNTSTQTNRVVSQVKKIVNDMRLKTKTTFDRLSGALKPPKFKEKTTTTIKPLIHVVTASKKQTHRNKLKTTTQQPTYYGALSRRFRLEPLGRPPEIIDN